MHSAIFIVSSIFHNKVTTWELFAVSCPVAEDGRLLMESKVANIGGFHLLDELRIEWDVGGCETISDFAGG